MEKMKHGELLNHILLKISEDFPESVRAWKNNSGAIKVDGRFVKFGVSGQADITGIIEGGKRLEIEVKVGKDYQKKDQKNYDRMITKFGGVYILARDYETVKRYIGFALKLNH